MLRLVSFAVCKETITVLRELLELALKGELRGLAMCYRMRDGRDRVLLTGVHKHRPEFAVSAAARLYWVASHDVDAQDC
jgi:hypothetical protein